MRQFIKSFLKKCWWGVPIIFVIIMVVTFPKKMIYSIFEYAPLQMREAFSLFKEHKTIKIGVPGPWDLIRTNTLFEEGLDLALEEINDGGGIKGLKVELVKDNDSNTVTGALDLAQKYALDKDYVAVIGHWNSYCTLPAAQIYNQNGVIMVSPISTLPELTEKGYNMVFRNTQNDAKTVNKLIQLANEKGWKNIAVLYGDSETNSKMATLFEKAGEANGINIIDRNKLFYDEESYLSAYHKWQYMKLDAIFIADVMTNCKDQMTWIRKTSKDIPVLAGDGFDYDTFIKFMGEYGENTYIATFYNPNDDNKKFLEFSSKFETKYSKTPDLYALLAYESLKLLEKSIDEANSLSPSKISNTLIHLKDFEGANGEIAFDKKGELSSDYVFIKKVLNSKFVYESK